MARPLCHFAAGGVSKSPPDVPLHDPPLFQLRTLRYIPTRFPTAFPTNECPLDLLHANPDCFTQKLKLRGNSSLRAGLRRV